MRLPRLLTGGAIVAVLAGTAACGLQSLEPKLELRDAASAFASDRTGALRLSLASSAAEYRAFSAEAAQEDGAAASGGITTGDPDSAGGLTSTAGVADDLSDADLERLLSSSLTIAYDGGAAKDDADDAARIGLRIGRLDAAEIRMADQVVYARVDLPGLGKQFPGMKDGVDSLHASLTGQGGEAPAPQAVQAPAEALFAGRWLSLDAGPGSWLDKQLPAASGGKSTGAGSGAVGGLTGGLPFDAPATLQKIAGKAFAHGVTVKRLDGDERLGDHLQATAGLRTVYTNIRGDLAGLLGDSSDESLAHDLPQPGDVPDRDLSVSFWVKDGTLTRAELDLAQFLDKPSGALVLRADSLPAEKITAPAGAVELDPQAIADQTGMSMDELLGGGPAMDAQTIAGYVDEDIRWMAEDDGAAPSVGYLQQAVEDMDGMADGLVIAAVGSRIQVNAGGRSACLVLPPTTEGTGTVTDGPCT